MINLLINNCGSQIKNIAELLHEGNINISYICTNYTQNLDSVIDNYLGPDMNKNTSIDDYVKFLIKLCKENNINLFLPFRRMEELIRYKNLFKNNGISMIIPDDIELFRILNDKAATYKLLNPIIKDYIPEYYTVNCVSDLIDKIAMIHNMGKIVCIKYVNDISSNSFRIINFEKHSIKELEQKTDKEKSKLSHMINYSDIKDMFNGINILPKEMVVMEYLSDEEVSCDCIKTSAGNIVIPRIKIDKKTQIVKNDKLLLELCNKILDYTNYNTPCNIQFKYNNNKPMLLEINTRMSGGIMIASWASGINLPLIAINQSAGINIKKIPEWNDTKMIQKIEYEKFKI